MSNAAVKIAIIGLGGVGERIFQACLQHSEIEIAVVCDIAEERVKETAGRYGVAWCTDYKSVLADAEIDAVYVGVPPKHHYAIVMEALKAGKHILCEKPLANSLQEAKEMSDLAKVAGVVHAMNFPTFYRTVFEELVKRVSNGFLGELRRIEVNAHFHKWPREWQQNNWIAGREQGGFIREVMPHYIHLIHVLFGDISNIRSEVQYPNDSVSCETGMVATAELANGVVILFNGLSQIAQQEEIRFTLYGSAGTLSLDNWSVLMAGGIHEPLSTVTIPENDRFLGLLTEFVQAIQGNQGNLVDFAEGYEIQDVLESLLESKKN